MNSSREILDAALKIVNLMQALKWSQDKQRLVVEALMKSYTMLDQIKTHRVKH